MRFQTRARALKRESRAAPDAASPRETTTLLRDCMATLISARTIAPVGASVARDREREAGRRSSSAGKFSRVVRRIDLSIAFGRPADPPPGWREKLKAVVPIKLAACRLAMMAKLGDRRDEFAEFAPAVNGISTWPRGAREICVARRDAAPPSFPCASVALINAFSVRAAGQLISRRNAIIACRSFPRSAMGMERPRKPCQSRPNRIERGEERRSRNAGTPLAFVRQICNATLSDIYVSRKQFQTRCVCHYAQVVAFAGMDSDVCCPCKYVSISMRVRALDANSDGALIKSAQRHDDARRRAERAFFLFHGHTGARGGSQGGRGSTGKHYPYQMRNHETLPSLEHSFLITA